VNPESAWPKSTLREKARRVQPSRLPTSSSFDVEEKVKSDPLTSTFLTTLKIDHSFLKSRILRPCQQQLKSGRCQRPRARLPNSKPLDAFTRVSKASSVNETTSIRTIMLIPIATTSLKHTSSEKKRKLDVEEEAPSTPSWRFLQRRSRREKSSYCPSDGRSISAHSSEVDCDRGFSSISGHSYERRTQPTRSTSFLLKGPHSITS